MKSSIRPFNRVLVANRGEIAIRIFRALTECNMQTICIFSKEDKYSLFRTKADESYMLNTNRGPVDAYLDMHEIIRIAKAKKVDAIHPGYGFLSENPAFVQLCKENDIVFIGPDENSMMAMGDKIRSKKIAEKLNIPTIPGYHDPILSVKQAKEIATSIGYPVLLKAAHGGGGRGMRIVQNEAEMQQQLEEAKEESMKAFASDLIFMEKYLSHPKHVEVQILADEYGHAVHLYDRDCSIQRRHQKVIEFAPAFHIPLSLREKMWEAAVAIAKEVNYKNAGTVEFLVDHDQFYFIEMNPRIQVEHTVTEEITGIDLVQAQIRIAQGYPLDDACIGISSQSDVKSLRYSIQCRVTSENPAKGFFPDCGKLTVYRSASGSGIRLDGGNGFTGAEITPYYDSLLVKVISYASTFEQCIQKSIRSLKEMRIRGVKTNIPFLINVLNNENFRKGLATTNFIEQTPSLLHMDEGLDRATKLLKFIGNIIVNENTDEKPDFHSVYLPKIQKKKVSYSMRQEFLRLGAEAFTQQIKNEKKLFVCDTTMRDAHQSLFATRMRTKDLVKAAEFSNAVYANAFSMEVWGGATFDACYRFLKESPWLRLQLLREKLPDVLLQMLFRASNAVGYASYPDNLIRGFIHEAAESGIDVFRIFDSLNWIENMKVSIEEALKTGKIVEAAICYSGDILNPEETKYTLDYYVRLAEELEKTGAHILCLKDMSGLLKPYAAKQLTKTLKETLCIPFHLHTHDTTGNGLSTILMAASEGLDIADVSLESMAGLTSQPSLNALVEALRFTQRDTGLNPQEVSELSKYYSSIRPFYEKFESGIKHSNTEIYRYEIPGGQYSNLFAQAQAMGFQNEFEEIKQRYAQANKLLGNIIKVTPSSKVVGDMAIFMHQNDLNEENIFEKAANLSFPDSVIELLKGMMGQPYQGFPKKIQELILKNEKPITVRPGSLLADVDFLEMKNKLGEFYDKTNMKNLLSYGLYPEVYEDYIHHLDHYTDITNLESHIFFYGLKKGEETTVKIGEGKYLIIKLIDCTKANEDGIRTLSFEVNGSMREIQIIDTKQEVKSDRKLQADPKNPKHIGASIPGKIGKIFVKKGETIAVNQALLTIEAMKMETTLLSSKHGRVTDLLVQEGAQVTASELLLIIDTI